MLRVRVEVWPRLGVQPPTAKRQELRFFQRLRRPAAERAFLELVREQLGGEPRAPAATLYAALPLLFELEPGFEINDVAEFFLAGEDGLAHLYVLYLLVDALAAQRLLKFVFVFGRRLFRALSADRPELPVARAFSFLLRYHVMDARSCAQFWRGLPAAALSPEQFERLIVDVVSANAGGGAAGGDSCRVF